MRMDPRARFTFEEIRRHPWFTRYVVLSSPATTAKFCFDFRPNSHLTDDGLCHDAVNLATRLMEGLHVNFNDEPSRSVPESQVESDSFSRLSSTQPETSIADVRFEWDRSWQSASQPLQIPQDFSSQDFWASLAEDPTMTQFAPQPQLPLSLVSFPFFSSSHTTSPSCSFCTTKQYRNSGTDPFLCHCGKTQNARKFQDICPSQRMTRFYSSYSFRQILPIIASALHRLGVAAPAFKASDYDDNNMETWIPVKTLDKRKCHLRGEILVERMAPDVLQVTFSKTIGDPLEWRRFFKVSNKGNIPSDFPSVMTG